MMTTRLLRRSILSLAALLTLSPPAFAADFIFSSGVYSPGVTAPEPLVAGDVLQINAGGNKFFSGVTLTNQSGLVNWNADTLFVQNGAFINNQSVWDARSDNALVNNGGPLSTFDNSGTFRKSGGLGNTTVGSISFVNSGIIDAQTGTINFGGGNATFNDGSQFIGAGATLVTNDASFNGAFTSSNLSLTGGIFTGGAAQINGNLNFTGGVITGNWEVASGQVLSGTGGNNKFLSTATLINNGTVQWQTGDSLFMQNGAALINNALHDVQVTSALVNNGGPTPSYINSSSGTLRVAAGQTLTIGSIAFTNGGTLQADGTLNFAGNNATFSNGTVFTGGGTNVVSSNANFNGTIASGNLVLQGGFFVGGPAVLVGTTDFTGGVFSGTWELASGQVLNGRDGANKFMSSAAFTNRGTVQWQSGNPLFLQNGSIFDNQGAFNMLVGTALVNNGGPLSTFINSGTLSVAPGQSGSVGSIAFVNNAILNVAGTLNFDGGNATFNSGSTFIGAGTVAVNNNATFNGAQTSTNLSLRNGAFTGNGAVIHGIVEFTGGLLQGNWDVAAGQTLAGRDGVNKFLNGVTLINHGTVAWQTGNTLFLQNGAVLDNRGLVDMQAGAALVNNGGPLSTFTNNGTLRVAAGQNSSVGSIAFVNNGGTLDVGAGGSLNFGGGNATFNGGTQFAGAGVNLVTNNATFNGSFSSTNLSLRNGAFTGNAAALNGSADFGGGVLQGSWTVAGGATLNGVDGANKFLSGTTLTNQGTLAWKTGDTLFFQNSAHLLNQGTTVLQTDAAMVFNGGPVGTFVNTGLVTKTGGSGTFTIGNNLGFDNQGVVDVRTGTIRLPDNFTNNGTLKGTGAFATNVLTNAGHVAPGGSPGTLTLNGNYIQTALGFMDTELASSALFDTFLVNGTASLDGTLALSCVLGCSLHDGDVFVILDSTGDLSGAFANVTTTGFGNGFQYDLVYDYVADLVRLEVIHAETSTAVPEPATWALTMAGLAVMGALARRRRRA